MESSFLDRVVVVTGAASGIGRGVALAFAERGANVGCVDRDSAGLRQTADIVKAFGVPHHSVQCDVSNSAFVDTAFSELSANLGETDVLVNIAGSAVLGSVHELSDAEWDDCLARNLTGTFYCCRAALPAMRARGSGVIVNMSSSLGRIAAPRFAAYAAAKAGVRALTMQMARDYGPQIRVNSISPAATDTPGLRHAIETSPDPDATYAQIAAGNQIAGRLARVDEVVAGILFAASDEASFMMGHDLVLCGGQTIVAY